MAPTLGTMFDMVEVISADHFSQHFRSHVVLHLAMDFREILPDNHPSVHLMHGVLTTVITVIQDRISSSIHVCKKGFSDCGDMRHIMRDCPGLQTSVPR